MAHMLLKVCFVLAIVMAMMAATASPLKVVIMDSGYSGKSQKLCKTGHYDAITDKHEIGADEIDHGTQVLDTVEASANAAFGDAKDSRDNGSENNTKANHRDNGARLDYCFIVLRVFATPRLAKPEDAGKAMYRAYKELLLIKPDVVNMSFFTSLGENWFDDLPIEEEVITELADQRTVFFIAAGNVRSQDEKLIRNLDQRCHVFPACLKASHPKNIVVVGGYLVPGKPHPGSYRGKIVDVWKPFCKEDLSFCGTSYATPLATGEYVAEYFRRVKEKRVEKESEEDYESKAARKSPGPR